MAYNVDLTGASEMEWDGKDKNFILRKRVDFTVAANQLAQAQTMGLFDIPAYVLVKEVFMVVRTADTDITDVDLGRFSLDGVVAAVDAFMDGLSLAATGLIRCLAGETYSPQNGTDGYMGEAAFSVGLTNNDAQTINGAVVDFYAVCLDLRA